MKRTVNIEYRKYESINFDLDNDRHDPNLIYHFTRQTRGPVMNIRTVDNMGYTLGIVRKGEAVFRKENQTRHLEYGSIFFTQHNDWYRLYKTDQEEIELTLIMFDPSIESRWTQLLGPLLTLDPDHPAQIIGITDLVFNQLRQIPENRIKRANRFALFLLQMIADEATLHTKDSSPEKQIYQKCLKYIQSHSATMNSVDEVPPACGISRCRLFELFRKYNGKTPRSYLEQLKIETAQEYLLSTNWSIEDVAEKMNYGNASTFSKAFSRITGMPPRQWRKNHSIPQ